VTTSPKVLKITLDLCPRERCVEVNRKRYIGKKALRHLSSSNIMGRKGQRVGRTQMKIL
jgi:hypothetical protein